MSLTLSISALLVLVVGALAVQPSPAYPVHSEQMSGQDVYGNYGFSHFSHTMTGDGDFRYERKTGARTEGGYGYNTNFGPGAVRMYHYHQVPALPASIRYHNPSFNNYPREGDLPPAAAAVHIPAVPVGPLQQQYTQQLDQPHYNQRLGSQQYTQQLDLAGSNNVPSELGHSIFTGPRYASMYDVNIPEVLYSRPVKRLKVAPETRPMMSSKQMTDEAMAFLMYQIGMHQNMFEQGM